MSELQLILDLSLVWLAAAIFGFAAVALKQPAMAGYMLAGLIIGPHGVKLISNSEQISVLAELGVALLLFALGLEVSFRQLLFRTNRVVAAGIFQIVITTLGFSWAVVHFGLAPDLKSGIVFGFIVALSSTVVATKMLSERGETDSIHGRILIPLLIVQDLSLIPAMSLIPALKDAGGDTGIALLMALGKALVLVAVVIIMSTKILPPLLARVASTNSRELFLLFMICLCLGVAIASHELGLSIALGAFLAGIMVSESPYAHQALSDLIPLRDLFATVFFVSVGMLLDPAYIYVHWNEVIIFVGVLIIGKALIATAASLLATNSLTSATLAGLCLAQVGEFSFVLATVGNKAGLITGSLYNLFFAAAVISMIASPSIISWLSPIIRRIRPPETLNADSDKQVSHLPLTGHTVVCGFGRVGKNVALAIREAGIPVAVVELDGAAIEDLKQRHIPFVYGDAGSRLVLSECNITEATTLVVTLPDPLAAVNIIKMAREVNSNLRILVRAHRPADRAAFKEAGAAQIVQPEFEASLELTKQALLGQNAEQGQLAKALSFIRHSRTEDSDDFDYHPPIGEIIGFANEDFVGAWFKVKESLAGKTIKELDLRNQVGVTVLAIRREEQVVSHPPAEFSLQGDDSIFVVGHSEQLSHCMTALAQT
ncbi:MAG: cation:proton antiporter [Candidatus Obscuribacterales bacterium]